MAYRGWRWSLPLRQPRARIGKRSLQRTARRAMDANTRMITWPSERNRRGRLAFTFRRRFGRQFVESARRFRRNVWHAKYQRNMRMTAQVARQKPELPLELWDNIASFM